MKNDKRYLIRRLFFIVLVLTITVMTGCNKSTPVVQTQTAEPIELIATLQSPITQSPIAPISPIAIPTSPSSETGEAKVLIAVPTPERLSSMNIELTSIALRPEDMVPIFDATYSITQPYEKPDLMGVDVVYPVRMVAHTTGFAEGYKTTIEVYEEFQHAVDAFHKVISEISGEKLSEERVGDALSVIFAGRAIEDVSIFTYELVTIKANVLVVVMIKTDKEISLDTLQEKNNLVLNRIKEK